MARSAGRPPSRARKRIIQVPIEEKLLSRIDETAGMVAESRAEFIRGACRDRLRDLETEEHDRRYQQGYETLPEDASWAESASRSLAKILPREKW